MYNSRSESPLTPAVSAPLRCLSHISLPQAPRQVIVSPSKMRTTCSQGAPQPLLRTSFLPPTQSNYLPCRARRFPTATRPRARYGKARETQVAFLLFRGRQLLSSHNSPIPCQSPSAPMQPTRPGRLPTPAFVPLAHTNFSRGHISVTRSSTHPSPCEFTPGAHSAPAAIRQRE